MNKCAAGRCCLGFLLLTVACSEDEEICRCGPAGISSGSEPPPPPAQPPATTLGTALTVLDGTVHSATENIQGSFRVRESAQGSSVALRAGKTDEVCVAGHVGVVPTTNDGDSYWGAEVSMTLNELPGIGPKPWQRDGVIGFAFDLSGTIPLAFRTVTSLRDSELPSESYCEMLSPRDGDTQYVLFGQLQSSCWEPATSKPLPEGPLIRFGWQVPADINIPSDLDFCISNLRPIRAASE